MEQWRVLEENPNYRISTLGRLEHIPKGKIVKGVPVTDKLKSGKIKITALGYSIPMPGTGKAKFMAGHRIVAKYFMPPQPSEEHTVDHVDRNPLNNSVSNLRWATRREQTDNRGNRVQVLLDRKLTPAEIEEMYQLSKSIPFSAIAKEYGVPPMAVSYILRFVHSKY